MQIIHRINICKTIGVQNSPHRVHKRRFVIFIDSRSCTTALTNRQQLYQFVCYDINYLCERCKQTISPAVARVDWPYRLYLMTSVRFSGAKKAIFRSDCSFIHAMMTLLYRTPQSTLGYDTVIRRTWMMAAGSNLAFRITAKPLQTETWLLLTAYRNSSSPSPTVPSPTPYDVRFSHNTCITEKQTYDRRQTDGISYHGSTWQSA